MDKDLAKLLIRLLYASKEELPDLLKNLDGSTGGHGSIVIPEKLVNETWREVVLKEGKGKLEDYQVNFRD